jgi:SAM-dependent methyltransferase
VGVRSRARKLRRAVSSPFRNYLDYKFGALEERIDSIATENASRWPLDHVNLSEHNAGLTPPTFSRVVSQVVSAAQFSEESFLRLRADVFPGTVRLAAGSADDGVHRKVWEYVFVLKAAEQHGILAPGRRALGLGVGTEPLPAVLAKHGLDVLATDQEAADDLDATWTSSGQHMGGLAALSKPEIVNDAILREHVQIRSVDMRAIPHDIGVFDLVWSCCAFEHLGSPEAGFAFVLRTLELLKPGGVAVHTTELELTNREQTADYGNLVIYRRDDLDRFADDVRALGFEMETNWYVALDAPADRHVSLPPYGDPFLKLFVGESVATSVGLLIRRAG